MKKQRQHVLVIDDDPANITLLTKLAYVRLRGVHSRHPARKG
ncbi:MAG: hypothetical protein R2941_04965 [Desulfobacterales bacterium]